MKRIVLVLAVGILTGCNGDKMDNKTPRMVTPGADSEKIGPAAVGGQPGPAGKGNKGGNKDKGKDDGKKDDGKKDEKDSKSGD